MPDSGINVPHPLGGIVLAGGGSTRMGRDKATLDWHGTPLVVHVALTLQRLVAPGPVVIVRAPGQILPQAPKTIETTTDPEPDRGPLMGLIAGLHAIHTRAERAYVVATDQPFLDGPLFADLPQTGSAAWITDNDRIQPLGAIYAVDECLKAAEDRLDTDPSLRGLLRAVGAVVRAADDRTAAALTSLDTPAAYAAALSRS